MSSRLRLTKRNYNQSFWLWDRCKTTVKKLFLCYITIQPPWVDGTSNSCSFDSINLSSTIKSVFPSSFKDQEVLRTGVQFALPCVTQTGVVEVFTFVLTSGDSKWTFGYCRHPPGAKTVTVVLSFLPWQEIFYRTLNYCAELDDISLVTFLERMYVTPVPEAGTSLYIPMSPKPFVCPCPSDFSLPSIPENRNVSEFYNALGTDSMVTLFAALLAERRIVVTSKKLSRLSSIVIAANLFLFPMSWQHIFIPILPTQLQDYLSAPMPFLIGVPLPVWNLVPLEALGQVVHVDGDTDTITTPFPEDLTSLPDNISNPLRKSLKGDRVLGDGLARAFLRALAQLMGHYQDAVRDDGASFDPDLFVHCAHPTHRSYIQDKLLRLQIFQQFIDERLEKIKSGSCESDEFEFESLAWRSHSRSSNGRNGHPVLKSIGSQNVTLKKAGKAVMMSMKRESGNLIDTVKHNSALKSAIRSVKEGGKTVKQKGHIAYSDMKSKFHVVLPTITHTGGEVTPDQEFEPITPDSTDYRRHTGGGAGPNHVDEKNTPNAWTKGLILPSETHLMSSCSASNLPRYDSERKVGHVELKPRLSKSEENLIDLETPEGGFGYTLENPLYDLLTNNSVFEDIVKTDEQLLAEYGLNDYFTKLNFSSSFVSSRPTSGSGLSASSTQSQHSSDAKWATFD